MTTSSRYIITRIVLAVAVIASMSDVTAAVAEDSFEEAERLIDSAIALQVHVAPEYRDHVRARSVELLCVAGNLDKAARIAASIDDPLLLSDTNLLRVVHCAWDGRIDVAVEIALAEQPQRDDMWAAIAIARSRFGTRHRSLSTLRQIADPLVRARALLMAAEALRKHQGAESVHDLITDAESAYRDAKGIDTAESKAALAGAWLMVGRNDLAGNYIESLLAMQSDLEFDSAVLDFCPVLLRCGRLEDCLSLAQNVDVDSVLRHDLMRAISFEVSDPVDLVPFMAAALSQTERDLLWQRAALLHATLDDFEKTQVAAHSISDVGVRSRVLADAAERTVEDALLDSPDRVLSIVNDTLRESLAHEHHPVEMVHIFISLSRVAAVRGDAEGRAEAIDFAIEQCDLIFGRLELSGVLPSIVLQCVEADLPDRAYNVSLGLFGRIDEQARDEIYAVLACHGEWQRAMMLAERDSSTARRQRAAEIIAESVASSGDVADHNMWIRDMVSAEWQSFVLIAAARGALRRVVEFELRTSQLVPPGVIRGLH